MPGRIDVQNEKFEYGDSMPFHVLEIMLQPGTNVDIRDRLMHHWHSELEICCCQYSGEHHFIDGREHISEPGKIIIVNPGSIHHFVLEPFEEENPRRIAVLLLVERDYLRSKFPSADKLCFSAEGQSDPEVAELMERLTCYSVRDDGISDKEAYSPEDDPVLRYSHIDHELNEWEKAEFEGLVLQVLAMLVRDRAEIRDHNVNAEGQSANDRMKEIIFFLEEHYNEQITQEEVAGHFYYSPSHFSSFFKKNMKMTFSEYLSDFRAMKARFDLLNTDDSIYTIAIRNGFSDSRRLIIAFRKLYGVTPLQYRKASKYKKR